MHVDDSDALIGAGVTSVGGRTIGMIVAVHSAPDVDLVVIEVGTANSEFHRVIPLFADALTYGDLVLPHPFDLVAQGPVVDPGARLSVGEIAALCGYYRIGTVALADRRLTERVTGYGDVAAQSPVVRPLPPIVVIRPSHSRPDESGPRA